MMHRVTGNYRTTSWGEEKVRAFLPFTLPPKDPDLLPDGSLQKLLIDAYAALARLDVAALMVPSCEWFLYGFVRKEAVISSQIEGTQATLQDLLTFEATQSTHHPEDVEEVCNYINALTYARAEIARPGGLPLCTRLLCEAHRRLMQGTRGAEKSPGEIRRSQNWIGGTRPGNARFVPPPPDVVPAAMSSLEKWIHADDPLPPLVRAGLAHVQFETIHPFLDGNGRIGRLLITLLMEHWCILKSPLLYLSLAFKRHRAEYYRHLDEVRTTGDWEGWTEFYLNCVREAANDGVTSAGRLFALLAGDRSIVTQSSKATVAAIRLLDHLPLHPIITLKLAMQLLTTTKPTALKAIDALENLGILHETTGRRRDRVFAYKAYLDVLTKDTD